MSIFSKIKDAIFGHPHPQEDSSAATSAGAAPAATTPMTTTPTTTTPTATTPTTTTPATTTPTTTTADAAPAAAAPAPMSEVDVEAILDSKPGADKHNWRVSIADLMRLLGLDPSFEHRRELAHELGDADYSGTAEENVWLHRQVMTKLAENGGKVPESLRD